MNEADNQAAAGGAAHAAVAPADVGGFTFVRSGDHVTQQLDWEKGPEQVRKALGEALGARNVAFLLGAGCSSMFIGGAERGVATMKPLAEEFCGAAANAGQGDGLVPAWAFDCK